MKNIACTIQHEETSFWFAFERYKNCNDHTDNSDLPRTLMNYHVNIQHFLSTKFAKYTYMLWTVKGHIINSIVIRREKRSDRSLIEQLIFQNIILYIRSTAPLYW